ncbi:MAG: hypothetical protein K2W95_00770 [Candidatus Obscuribacterales bacterium]|nr:hypothetical protein [Candidatus Obscuribacterales bacterium]
MEVIGSKLLRTLRRMPADERKSWAFKASYTDYVAVTRQIASQYRAADNHQDEAHKSEMVEIAEHLAEGRYGYAAFA